MTAISDLHQAKFWNQDGSFSVRSLRECNLIKEEAKRHGVWMPNSKTARIEFCLKVNGALMRKERGELLLPLIVEDMQDTVLQILR